MRCAVFGCNNNNKKTKHKKLNENASDKISYFKFPKNEDLRQKWVEYCRREDAMNVNTARMCSVHFYDEDIRNSAQFDMGFVKYRFLRLGALPRKPMNYKKQPSEDNQIVTEIATQIKTESSSSESEEEEEVCAVPVGDPLGFHAEELDAAQVLQERDMEITILKSEVAELKRQKEHMLVQLNAMKRKLLQAECTIKNMPKKPAIKEESTST